MKNIPPSSTTTIKLFTQRVIDGLEQPLYVTAPSEDENRIFILEQKSGNIKIFDLNTKQLQPDPFLTIPSDDLLKDGFEQGLLGLAFHPNYEQNGKFYVSYTAVGGGDAGQTKVVEYTVNKDDPNKANPDSDRTILTIPQPQENHNGGWLAFGKDGYLYWASGDGGGSGFIPGIPSESDNSQDITNNLLGKILRLDVNSDAFPSDNERNYAIPPNNPFVGKEGDDEIWAYGVRNPWRPSFDRVTGDLYIADVGQSQREEINFQPSSSQGGENYGWNRYEGTIPYKPGDTPTNLVNPIYEYDHSIGNSVTGGYVYQGSVSQLKGTYFFADFISSKIWSLSYNNGVVSKLTDRTTELAPSQPDVTIDNIASFGEDAAGNLYIVDLDGEIFRLQVQKTISGGNGNDLLLGDSSEDFINGRSGNDTLRGAAGNDILRGGAGSDRLEGNGGSNRLNGGSRNDRLIGGAGNDSLVGESGKDSLTGGRGNDNFIFNSPKEGVDVISDFLVTADSILVKATGFGGGLIAGGAISPEKFVIKTAAADSSDRIIYNKTNGSLFFDEDGIGVIAPVLIASLKENLNLTNANIVVF